MNIASGGIDMINPFCVCGHLRSAHLTPYTCESCYCGDFEEARSLSIPSDDQDDQDDQDDLENPPTGGDIP
jgi:hypothetical protein